MSPDISQDAREQCAMPFVPHFSANCSRPACRIHRIAPCTMDLQSIHDNSLPGEDTIHVLYATSDAIGEN